MTKILTHSIGRRVVVTTGKHSLKKIDHGGTRIRVTTH